MATLGTLQQYFEALAEIADPPARAAALAALDLNPAQSALLLRMLAADADEATPAEPALPSEPATPTPRLPQLLDALVASSDPQARIGQRLGPYLLLNVLGQGGMGAVYGAERVDGEVQQRVAIKLITQPDPGGLLVARIESERRLLANLEHPGIARFLDAGRDAAGHPWLAMEWVDGRPLLDYVRARKLSVTDRIDLVIAVCAAVAHAHGRLVVHRDLKSSNVLVTADGRPRLLDFGIARSLENSALEQTRTAERFLSPLNAAPEQLRGDAATVAIDLYALGVLLYQLLADRPPLLLAGLAPAEMQRQILMVEPPLLSHAAAGAADPEVKQRATTLRGDLEQIVARCLRKLPEQRYATVAALADDLGRYLRQEPVLARGPGAAYRALRFVQRHRWSVLAATLVFVTLATLTLVLWRQGLRLAEQRDAEVLARARADRVSGFLAGLFTQSSPRQTGGVVLSARDLLDRGLPRLLSTRDPHPGDAAVLLAMAGAYGDLGAYEPAGTAWERARNLSAEQANAVDAQLLWLTGAQIQTGLGHYDAALALLEQAQPSSRTAEQQLLLAIRRSQLLYAQGNVPGALAALAEVRGRWAADAQVADHVRAELDSAEGRLRSITGDAQTGLALLEHALSMRRRLLAAADPDLADTLLDLARAASSLEQHARAQLAYEEARDIYHAAFGARHLLYAVAVNGLGMTALAQERHHEARALIQQALDIRSAQLGPEHPTLAASHLNLALVLRHLGELPAAQAQIVRAESIAAKAFPDGHFTRDLFALEHGRILHAMGRIEAAADMLWQTRRRMRASGIPQPRNVARTELSLAELCLDVGDLAAARSLIDTAAPVLRKAYSQDRLTQTRIDAVQAGIETGKGNRSDPRCRAPSS